MLTSKKTGGAVLCLSSNNFLPGSVSALTNLVTVLQMLQARAGTAPAGQVRDSTHQL